MLFHRAIIDRLDDGPVSNDGCGGRRPLRRVVEQPQSAAIWRSNALGSRSQTAPIPWPVDRPNPAVDAFRRIAIEASLEGEPAG